MTYSLRSRLDHLGQRMSEINSRSITYKRSVLQTTLTATVRETESSVLFPELVGVSFRVREFIIDSEDFIIDGVVSVPERGDRISDEGMLFEVLPNSEMPHYSYTTESRQRMIIRTKQIAE